MLKLFILNHRCKYSNLIMGKLKRVHIVPQQSRANLSVCSVHYVNYLASQFELTIHVFGQIWYHNRRQVFPSNKIFCCNDQLILQSHKLVDIFLCHCRIMYQSEFFVVIFLQNFEFYIQLIGITFVPRKLSKSVLAFVKILIIGIN